MQVHCLHDAIVPLKELKPHPKNANKHPDDQIERLSKILSYQGWRYPIKVSKRSGFVTSGHGRIAAAKLNGWLNAPVNFQEYQSEEQEIADVHSDNAIASWAELDLANINTQVTDLGPDFDIDLLGIKDFTLDVSEKTNGLTDEDDVPEPPKEAKTKLGDLYQLGNHRLLCGDSTSMEEVERLMNGEKANMVFTDPPYGMNLDTDYSKMGQTGLKHRKVIGDSDDFKDELITSILAIQASEIFIWGSDYFAQLIPERNKGSWIVWDKRSKGDDNIGLMDGQFGSDFELCWSKKKHKRELARIVRPTGYYAKHTDDIACHPTQKPIALAEWFFSKYGHDKDLVIDLFLGSGSTLIACEKTNRRCFGMEVDPLYCDVIVERWEKYTGKKAVKIG